MSSNVQFDEDTLSYGQPRQTVIPGAPAGQPQYYTQNAPGMYVGGMAGWLIRHGWAKNEKVAQVIMLSVVVVNLIITYLVFSYFIQ